MVDGRRAVTGCNPDDSGLWGEWKAYPDSEFMSCSEATPFTEEIARCVLANDAVYAPTLDSTWESRNAWLVSPLVWEEHHRAQLPYLREQRKSKARRALVEDIEKSKACLEDFDEHTRCRAAAQRVIDALRASDLFDGAISAIEDSDTMGHFTRVITAAIRGS